MLIITRKQILKAFAVMTCLIICGGILYLPRFSASLPASSQKTDWGLGYRKNGEMPTGNASHEFLKKYDALYGVPTDEKVIYLTFDAGYEAGYTPNILDVLKKHNVKATFFIVGNYLNTQPELVKRMNEEGHIVGNHTYSHPDMSKISDLESFKKEIEAVENGYKSITGTDMKKFYRPPQGKFSEENLKMAQSLGYKTVFWSLAYVDWYQDNQPAKEEAFSKLIPRIHPGAVVLLHSTSKTNSEILDELLTKWEEMGYSFKSLEEIEL